MEASRPPRGPCYVAARTAAVSRMSATFQPVAHQPLAPHTTLGVGGAARWLARAAQAEDIAAALAFCAAERLPLLVLGGGSNLVIADAGWPGLALRIETRGITFTPDGDSVVVEAGAGETWDALVAASVARGLAGLECLSGIPGSVGGTPIQNVGAYGQEVADTLVSVTAYDRQTAQVVELAARDCGFAYRMSRFKTVDAGRFVVLGVRFRLRSGPPTLRYPDLKAELESRGVTQPTLADVRAAVIAVRARKGMVVDATDPDSRSVGSFFMNPVLATDAHTALAARLGVTVPAHPAGEGQVKVPAAWLIEQAGFRKGHVAGHAGLSSKHPLALINRGGASAREIVALAATIKRTVHAHTGVTLRAEPVLVGFGADPDADFLSAP